MQVDFLHSCGNMLLFSFRASGRSVVIVFTVVGVFADTVGHTATTLSTARCWTVSVRGPHDLEHREEGDARLLDLTEELLSFP